MAVKRERARRGKKKERQWSEAEQSPSVDQRKGTREGRPTAVVEYEVSFCCCC